ncbi:MAG: type I methionyl aminopeptidase [Anaerolineae bacterium]|nr:type I methionyl aminopeptidase [Anaerolineae bacterium]
MIILKNAAQIQAMREAGRIVARALEATREAIRPGVSTWELDRIAARVFEQHQARPAFLGYPSGSSNPFPATITASINDEILHGIPSKTRILKEGDIVSIDTGCHYQGFVGDSAYTMGVGRISSEAQRLLEVTERALYVGIEAARPGHETRDIARAVQHFVESHGFNVIRGYAGHGVGREMHEDPEVPVYWPGPLEWVRLRKYYRSAPLRPGMTFAIEPMVSAGHPATAELDDEWTVVMVDQALSAHFEHTLAILEGEPLILTQL